MKIFITLINISPSSLTGVTTVFEKFLGNKSFREKIRKNVIFEDENNNFFLFLVELHLEHNSIKGVENPDNLKNQSSGHPFKLSFIIFLTCLAKLFKLFFVSYPRRPKIVFLIIHIDIQIKHCLSSLLMVFLK